MQCDYSVNVYIFERRSSLRVEQLPQACGSELAECGHVAVADLVYSGERRRGSSHARFTKEMQHRIRRTIAGVLDVIRRASRELVGGVEAGDLQLAFETESGDGGVCLIQELVVIEEIAEHVRMDQEAGLAAKRIGGGKKLQFLRQLFSEPFGRLLLADPIANQPTQVRARRKRAQAEPDDGFFHPISRRGDDAVGGLAARCRAGGPAVLHH